MTEKLKPCPFCGDDNARLEEGAFGFQVSCHPTTGCGSLTDYHDTEDEAAATWNRRASPDMEQRAWFVMVPPDDSEQLRLAVRAVKQTLFRGGSGVSLPADSWIERAFIAGMLAAANPIEALEGGKTDSGRGD